MKLKKLKRGDRVVIPFTIACGNCLFCQKDLWSLCDNTNPNAHIAETMYGYSGSSLFGYSHIYGGYAGGQAQYARVPFADVGPIKIENDLPDEKVLFLSDIYPTGYQGAENANISTWRYGCSLGLRSCWPFRYRQRVHAWGGEGNSRSIVSPNASPSPVTTAAQRQSTTPRTMSPSSKRFGT